MRNPSFVTVFTLLLITFLIGSCEAISGFFNTGKGFSIVIVAALAVIIALVAVRIKKRKKA